MSSLSTAAGAASSSSGAVKKTISHSDWQKLQSQYVFPKRDLNKLVMNYLVLEGYKEAAEKFVSETGQQPNMDLSSIEDRMKIRAAIQQGKISEAVELVNDLDPEILDMDDHLFFQLQTQKVIEMLRVGDIEQAIEFAQEELAPRAEENPAFLVELEKTMALLAFETNQDSPVSYLLDIAQRQKVASELNAAILSAQSLEKDPKLPFLLKAVMWSQNLLAEKVNYPRMTDLVHTKYAFSDKPGSSAPGSTSASAEKVTPQRTASGSQPMDQDPPSSTQLGSSSMTQ
eukprot:Clim_evm9s227 gene=Clim_evmTU9s227